MAKKSLASRFLSRMALLRHVIGPAQVGDLRNLETVRSDEARAEDLKKLGLRRVTTPDGHMYLEADTQV